MRWTLLIGLAVALTSGFVVARDKKPGVDPKVQEAVDLLIKQLDDPSFVAREEATLDLMRMGSSVRPVLAEALKGSSPEVRYRIRRILLHLEEVERRATIEAPLSGDWPMLKRGPGRGASLGDLAIRKLPDVQWYAELPGVTGRPYFDTPLLAAGDMILTVTRRGIVTALHRNTGEIAWSVETGERVFAGPVTASGVVYIPGRSLVALSVKTGRTLWRWTTDYGVSASPLIHGKSVYAVEKGERLVALDPKTGDEKWRARLSATSSPPVPIGDLIVVGHEKGVRAVSAENGKKRWSFRTRARVDVAVAVLPDRIVVADNNRNIYAISPDRGRRLWHRKIPEGRVLESPVVYGGALFFSTNGATLRALRASDGGDLWTRWAGSLTQSSPCVAGGLIYFCAGSQIRALECANGDDVWNLQLASAFSSPILIQGTLYVVAMDGVAFALR